MIHFFQEEKLTIFCCSWYKTFPFWQKFDQRSSWKFCHLIFLSSASSKTQIYFQHVNVFKMLLTIIMTMVMMTIISAMMIITKYSLPTIDFATRYSTRYSDFLLQPYSNPTRSQKSLLVCACKRGFSFEVHIQIWIWTPTTHLEQDKPWSMARDASPHDSPPMLNFAHSLSKVVLYSYNSLAVLYQT